MRLLPPPYESEPDGNRFLLHHGLWGLVLAGVGWFLWTPGLSPELGSILFLAGLLVALDDAVDHSVGGHIRRLTERYLGVRMGTPLDYAYRRVLSYIRRHKNT